MKIILSSKRQDYMARVSIFLIIVALIVGMVGCGGGTTSPIRIYNWFDLDKVRNDLGGSYILMNDLDSTTANYFSLASATANDGKGWDPIGSSDEFFTGTFDGQGYEIRDVVINGPTRVRAGLFGAVEEGVIKNLGVVNATVTGNAEVGCLVGWNNYGTVDNCYFAGSVIGNDNVGGLMGWNMDGSVSNSYSTGSVAGENYVGGLVGWNDGTVSNSYSTGSVTGYFCVGGLLGDHYDTVSNSYSTGSVTGDYIVGGLMGWNAGTVSNSYYNYDEVLINGENIITIGALFGQDFEQWLAQGKFLDVNERLSQESGYYVANNVSDFKQLLAFGQDGSLKFRLKNDLDLATEPNFYIPYLAGEFDGNGHNISNMSFNFDFVSKVGLFGYLDYSGNVTHLGAENVNITGDLSVGCLVGNNNGALSNCYSTGNVTGSSFTGGMVGSNYGSVSNSYSTGSVTGSYYVGGLVGDNYYGTVSNSYSTGSVAGDEDVGGLVGWNDGTVSNSYATGSVAGDNYVGGLVGWNDGPVSNSYSTGSVTGSEDVGGLVGGNSYTVTNSFWDTETSGQTTSPGGEGKTTAEMQDIATFSGATWNIVAVGGPGERNLAYIWNIVDDETYPFLSWQPVV